MNKIQVKKNIALLCAARGTYSLAFSVMFVSFALYFNSVLHIKEQLAAQITALFLALNYGLPLLGGWLGNHFINFKILYKCGLIIQAMGFLLFSQVSHPVMVNLALSLILIGCMVFSVSIIEFISHTVEEYPSYRRPAMLLNYGSINVAYIIGIFISGVFASIHKYRLLFLLLTICPIICIFLLQKYLIYDGKPNKEIKYPIFVYFIIAIILSLIIQGVLRFAGSHNDTLLFLCGIGLIITLLYALLRSTTLEKINIGIFSFFMFIYILFWGVFLLTPTIMMYLIRDAVNLLWHGLQLQPQWLDIDPVILVIGTPLLAFILGRIKTKYNISVPTYLLFGLAMLCVALGSYVMSISITNLPFNTKLSIYPILIYISFLAIAELFIAPEGYTLPARLTPKRLRGTLTGAWIASISIGGLISSLIADRVLKESGGFDIANYQQMFHLTFIYALGITVIVFIFGLFTRRRF